MKPKIQLSDNSEQFCLRPLLLSLQALALYRDDKHKSYYYILHPTLAIVTLIILNVWSCFGKFTEYLPRRSFDSVYLYDVVMFPCFSFVNIFIIISSQMGKTNFLASFFLKCKQVDAFLGLHTASYAESRRRLVIVELALSHTFEIMLVCFAVYVNNMAFGWSVYKYFLPQQLCNYLNQMLLWEVYNYVCSVKIRLASFNHQLTRTGLMSRGNCPKGHSACTEYVLKQCRETYDHIYECFLLINDFFGLQIFGVLVAEVITLTSILNLAVIFISQRWEPFYDVSYVYLYVLYGGLFTFRLVSIIHTKALRFNYPVSFIIQYIK